MLQEAAARRVAAEEQARSRFEDELTQHRKRLENVRGSRDSARRQHRWWAWLRYAVALHREQRLTPRPPASEGATDQEEILTAGMTGEEMVAASLGRALGDDWVLLRGYRNSGGEIDHVLLGPKGLVAIEVKHRNATVHCDGDDWWFDKYDRYGNHVDHGTIGDQRGRSPSVQLNEPANLLEEFLRANGHPAQITRVVLLTHPRSRLGNCRNLTVHLATSTDTVIGLLRAAPPVLDEQQASRVQQLIVRNHRQRRRPPR